MTATKTIEVDREKVISILNIALSSEVGSSTYIPCSSKKEQKDMHICVIRELTTMSKIDPTDSASLTHRAIFKDGRFWIVISRVEPALSSVFIKSKTGKLTKVTI